jgi:hypothetical protein
MSNLAGKWPSIFMCYISLCLSCVRQLACSNCALAKLRELNEAKAMVYHTRGCYADFNLARLEVSRGEFGILTRRRDRADKVGAVGLIEANG